MDIVVVNKYLETKKQRIELGKRVALMSKELESRTTELTKIRSEEDSLVVSVDQDSLITQKSVKVINKLLENAVQLVSDNFIYPLVFSQLTFKASKLTVNLVTSKPLFTGWETKTPYYSYQTCSLSLDVPEKPSENHIPRYQTVFEYELPVTCWERGDGSLKMWKDEKAFIVFVLNKDGE